MNTCGVLLVWHGTLNFNCTYCFTIALSTSIWTNQHKIGSITMWNNETTFFLVTYVWWNRWQYLSNESSNSIDLINSSMRHSAFHFGWRFWLLLTMYDRVEVFFLFFDATQSYCIVHSTSSHHGSIANCMPRCCSLFNEPGIICSVQCKFLQVFIWHTRQTMVIFLHIQVQHALSAIQSTWTG